MSRILLVGMGVPGVVAARRHAGPGIRAAHFAIALAADGHDVLLLAVLADGEAAPAPVGGGEAGARGLTIEYTTERELISAAMRARVAAFAADAMVGVTVYAASLAVRLAPDLPLWADVFGDIMAEAQAKALRSGNDWSIVHFWTLLRGVLEHADRFSAVSVAQSYALVGQLGLAGRLSMRTAGEELVTTIPCAAEATKAVVERSVARRELGLADDDFVLLVSGGVNTWFDVETFCRGIAIAMEAEPRLRLLVTGGAITGHDELSHAALVAGLAVVDASRVRMLGWIDSSRLAAVYAAADLGVHVERSLYERRLGAENRVVEWLANGLPCATTALSETGQEMVAAGLALFSKPGDAEDLARVVVDAARGRCDERTKGGNPRTAPDLVGFADLADTAARVDMPDLADLADRGRQWAARERSFAATAKPLRDWCREPRFAGDHDGARLVRIGLLSHPETSVEMLEAYVAALPLREVARRGLRWVARRAWGNTG